jgi:hypothetical protein
VSAPRLFLYVLTPLLLVPAADGQGLFQADATDGFTLCHASGSGFAVTRSHSIVARVVRIWPLLTNADTNCRISARSVASVPLPAVLRSSIHFSIDSPHRTAALLGRLRYIVPLFTVFVVGLGIVMTFARVEKGTARM